MGLEIGQFRSAPVPERPSLNSPASESGQDSPFADLVRNLLQESSDGQSAIQESVNQLISGETESLHEVVMTASQAQLSFELVMEIRDRLMSAYQEVMRMQV